MLHAALGHPPHSAHGIVQAAGGFAHQYHLRCTALVADAQCDGEIVAMQIE